MTPWRASAGLLESLDHSSSCRLRGAASLMEPLGLSSNTRQHVATTCSQAVNCATPLLIHLWQVLLRDPLLQLPHQLLHHNVQQRLKLLRRATPHTRQHERERR